MYFYGKSLQSSAQFLSKKNEGVAFLTKCQDPKNTGVPTNEDETQILILKDEEENDGMEEFWNWDLAICSCDFVLPSLGETESEP